jgi:hypothetical protein
MFHGEPSTHAEQGVIVCLPDTRTSIAVPVETIGDVVNSLEEVSPGI